MITIEIALCFLWVCTHYFDFKSKLLYLEIFYVGDKTEISSLALLFAKFMLRKKINLEKSVFV